MKTKIIFWVMALLVADYMWTAKTMNNRNPHIGPAAWILNLFAGAAAARRASQPLPPGATTIKQ